MFDFPIVFLSETGKPNDKVKTVKLSIDKRLIFKNRFWLLFFFYCRKCVTKVLNEYGSLKTRFLHQILK